MIPLVLLVSTFLFYPAAGSAEDETKPAASELTVIPFKKITKKGLVFRVPEDMPFAEKDGILKPIAFEEYFYSKIVALEKTVVDLEARLKKTESKLAKLQAPERVEEKKAPSPENIPPFIP